jgi:hypothetical protein
VIKPHDKLDNYLDIYRRQGPAKRQACCPSRLTGFGGAVTDGQTLCRRRTEQAGRQKDRPSVVDELNKRFRLP